MKTAIVYDRVNKWGGAEQVLLALHEIFPDAHLFTSVYNKKTAKWAEVFPEINTSFLQKILFAKTNHEYFAPFMPLAFESFSFDEYELVLSVTSEAAKGIITRPDTVHICYCLTPTRYLWSGYDNYFNSTLLRGVAKPVVDYLKRWDKIAAHRLDHIISISSAVQERINKYYDRESEVIFPPVDIKKFQRDSIASLQNDNEEFYLIVSRLVSYKKVDLAVNAFNKLGEKLVVVGKGREENKLRKFAKDNIDFRGFVTDEELIELYHNAKAFINPQEEDFGITAVEAQAAGVPVIAYRSGGTLDTIIENKTGVFFDQQNEYSLIEAVNKFEEMKFGKSEIIKNSWRFSIKNFKNKFKAHVNKIVKSS